MRPRTLDEYVEQEDIVGEGRYLRRIGKLGQPDKKDQMIEDLKARYPRRRAMIEELDNIR